MFNRFTQTRADTLTSFDEGTAEAEVVENLYPSVGDALLPVHPWGFATGQVTLAKLAAAPIANFIRLKKTGGIILIVIGGKLSVGASGVFSSNGRNAGGTYTWTGRAFGPNLRGGSRGAGGTGSILIDQIEND